MVEGYSKQQKGWVGDLIMCVHSSWREFQDYRVYRISGLQGLRVSGVSALEFAGLQNSRITGYQDFRISGFQGFVISSPKDLREEKLFTK